MLASVLAGVAVGWLTSTPIAATVPRLAHPAVGLIGHDLIVDGPADRQDQVRVFE